MQRLKEEKEDNYSTNEVEFLLHDKDTLCGIGNWAPSGLQKCANVSVFTGIVGFNTLWIQTLSVYIASQVTSLERQFGLQSTDSGFLVSCSDIGFLVVILFVSHYGRNANIPRVLTWTAIAFGIASIACCLPQFIQPASLQKTGTNASSNGSNGYICNATQPDTCTADQSHDKGSSSQLMIIIGIGLVIQGICKSPRSPFTTIYIDNNVANKQKTGVYLGVIETLSLFGPALAYILGGVFSNFPVDLRATELKPTDPRWIGAWWLGFLVFGMVSIVTSFPVIFFPRRIPGSWKEKETQKEAITNKETLCEKVKGLPLSVLRVMKNPIYTFCLLGISFGMFSSVGVGSFGPKYIENVFFVPAWEANVIQGAVAALALGVGTCLGGYLTYRFKMDIRGCIKFVVLVCSIALALESLNLTIFGCQNATIIGLPSDESDLQDSAASCNCSGVPYLPVCGVKTQNTYFSPCHAGCLVHNETMYSHCTMENGSDVTLGICDTGCKFLYPSTINSLISGTISMTKTIPLQMILLRVVKDEDKSLAFGIMSFCIALFGFIPGPIVYGKIVDTTCRLWNYTCGSRGSCALYDIVELRFKMLGVTVGLRALSLLFFVITLLVHKYVWKLEKQAQDTDVKMQTNIEN